MKKILFCLCAVISTASAQRYYTYISDLGANYAELSWGTLDGVNTIGRSSPSHGEATIEIAGRTATSRLNYVTIGALEPDKDYPYKISIGNTKVGEGTLHTWSDTSDKLTFFVIGDYGTGNDAQYKIAARMWQEFQNRQNSDSPVRFILSTGDNIYGNIATFVLGAINTGSKDSDFEPKFFKPYEPLLQRIPFFPTLGNHDGNETEARGDLPTLLDNYPFPHSKPGRWYEFDYGKVARFFGLDSTKNTESGSPHGAYHPDGPQFQWMRQEFAKPHPPWVIPYYHHPVFNAGPLHAPSMRELSHWVDLFQASGVKVVFNGHEHNLQISEDNGASRGIRFITSGAGGELRTGDIQKHLVKANIEEWAPQNHFLVVEIVGKTMKVTPLGYEPITVRDRDGKTVAMPITITLP